MLVCLMLSQRSLKLSFFKNLFFFCCFDWVISNILSSSSLMHSSLLPHLLLIPSYEFFNSVVVFFSSDWLFFIFSNSLLKFSLCSSILFLSSVSFLIAIALNSLSGKLCICFIRVFFTYFLVLLSEIIPLSFHFV